MNAFVRPNRPKPRILIWGRRELVQSERERERREGREGARTSWGRGRQGHEITGIRGSTGTAKRRENMKKRVRQTDRGRERGRKSERDAEKKNGNEKHRHQKKKNERKRAKSYKTTTKKGGKYVLKIPACIS